MKKEIHSFYDSGEKNVDKSVFLKMMFAPIILIIVIYLGYNYFVGEKAPIEIIQDDVNTTILSDNYEEIEEDYSYDYNGLKNQDKFSA